MMLFRKSYSCEKSTDCRHQLRCPGQHTVMIVLAMVGVTTRFLELVSTEFLISSKVKMYLASVVLLFPLKNKEPILYPLF